MATTKNRVNISLPKDVREALSKLAKRDSTPVATKAARLLESALELEEDQVWDALAEKRDSRTACFVSHEQAWK